MRISRFDMRITTAVCTVAMFIAQLWMLLVTPTLVPYKVDKLVHGCATSSCIPAPGFSR